MTKTVLHWSDVGLVVPRVPTGEPRGDALLRPLWSSGGRRPGGHLRHAAQLRLATGRRAPHRGWRRPSRGAPPHHGALRGRLGVHGARGSARSRGAAGGHRPRDQRIEQHRGALRGLRREVRRRRAPGALRRAREPRGRCGASPARRSRDASGARKAVRGPTARGGAHAPLRRELRSRDRPHPRERGAHGLRGARRLGHPGPAPRIGGAEGRDVRERSDVSPNERALRVRAGGRAHPQGEERGRAGMAAGRRAALPRADAALERPDRARARAAHDRGRARASAGRARWCRRRERRAGRREVEAHRRCADHLRGCWASLARDAVPVIRSGDRILAVRRSRPSRGGHPPTDPPRRCGESACPRHFAIGCRSLLRATPRTAAAR